MPPDVSVCIVNFNGGERLASAVASVFASVGGLSSEVIVVDNASTDGSLARVTVRWPTIRVIRNSTNVGFGRANNQAMQLAAGDFFLLLNNDAVLEPDALSRMLSAAIGDRGAAFVSCRVLDKEGNLQVTHGPPPTLAEYLPFRLRRRRLAKAIIDTTTSPVARSRAAHLYAERYGYNHTHPVQNLCGVCLIVRRAAAAEIGLLDERYFMYYEDIDWSERAVRAGWRLLYVADATAHHAWAPIPAKSTSASLGKARRFSQGLYYRQHGGDVSFLAMAAALWLRYLSRLLPYQRESQATSRALAEFQGFVEGGRAFHTPAQIPRLREAD